MPHPLNASETEPLIPEIVALYRLVYAAPPWSETREQLDAFPSKLDEALARPGFTALATRDATGRLVGVCYGWPTPADLSGHRVYDVLRRALGPDTTTTITRDAFELVELFVHPEAQHQGIGRRLLTRLTAPWPASWLLTRPSTPAADLYRRLGWREQGSLHPDYALSVFARTAPE